MSIKKRRRNIMRAKGASNRKAASGGVTAGYANTTPQPHARFNQNQPPPWAQTVPAVSLIRGRSTYACADNRCSGRIRISNGYTITCNRCGRVHQLPTPNIIHWENDT